MTIVFTRLNIKNFKGIKSGDLENLSQVNILVGRNNSGKSTILNALIALRTGLISQDFLGRSGLDQIVRRGANQETHGISIPGRETGSFNQLWFRMETSDPIQIDASLNGQVEIEQRWEPKTNDSNPEIITHINIGTSGQHRWPSARI